MINDNRSKPELTQGIVLHITSHYDFFRDQNRYDLSRNFYPAPFACFVFFVLHPRVWRAHVEV